MIEETSAGLTITKENTKKFSIVIPPLERAFKGKMEKNETTHETAIRETKEETGITDIVFVENFEEWIEYNFKYQGELVQKKVVFFLAETKTEEIKISHEHSGYTWMDYNASMEKTTFDNAKTVLTKAEKLLSNTL